MEPFDVIHRANAEYLERLYQQYLTNPRTLDAQWLAFFKGFEFGYGGHAPAVVPAAGEGVAAPDPLTKDVYALVNAYRELGHGIARLDPLGHNRPSHPLLALEEFGVSLADLDHQVGKGGFLGPTDGTLRDLLEKLRLTYCQTLGVEYVEIDDKTQRTWLQQQMEPILNQPSLPPSRCRQILSRLATAEVFEHFLHTRYIGYKRFSLEGAEALIPLLDTLVEEGAALGVAEMVMGTAHRGRLNVLAHLLRKPYEIILSEFEETLVPQNNDGNGDVKYHLGFSHDHVTAQGRPIHLSLSANPSHLELVNPVIAGIVHAKQQALHDIECHRVVDGREAVSFLVRVKELLEEPMRLLLEI